MKTTERPSIREIMRDVTPETTAGELAIVISGFGYAKVGRGLRAQAQDLLDRHRGSLALYLVSDADTVIATSEEDALWVVAERHDLPWPDVAEEPVERIEADVYGMWWDGDIPSTLVPYVDQPYRGDAIPGVHITAPVRLLAALYGRSFLASTEC